MKKMFLTCALIYVTLLGFSQNTDYKVVFDMTSKDPVNQQTVVRETSLIRETNPDANIEVVVYGQGLDLVITSKTTQASAIKDLIANKNVSFKVCALAMKRNNVDESQLLPGVEVVPDGIYEIISKQKEGWGYIKVSH